MDKNVKFLKGSYCKIQTPIRWKLKKIAKQKNVIE